MAEAKTAQPRAVTDADRRAGDTVATNTGKPAGNAPTAADAANTNREQAAGRKAEAKADAHAADTLDKLAARPPVPLTGQVTHDVIGRRLPDDPQARREQQREATAIRQRRVEEDVMRVNRGLPPKYAVTDLED